MCKCPIIFILMFECSTAFHYIALICFTCYITSTSPFHPKCTKSHLRTKEVKSKGRKENGSLLLVKILGYHKQR